MVFQRNREAKKCSGETGPKMTYLELSDGQGGLICMKCKDGHTLNKSITSAEQQWGLTMSDEHLEEPEKMALGIWEYDGAVHAALNNWIEGVPRD